MNSEVAELRDECWDLRRQVNLLLIGLIVATFTITAFLGVQSIRAGKDLEQAKMQAGQVFTATHNDEAAIHALLARLTEYSRSHPDFAQVLAKYQKPENGNTTPALPPSLAPKK